MKEVNSSMTIRDVLMLDEGVVPILMSYGLHCLGCPHATMETLEEASQVHSIDLDSMIRALNHHLATQNA